MIYEVAAAVDYVLSLVSPAKPPGEALAAFASTLKDGLERRCQGSWRTEEPEFGSAYRSVAWQLHPGGEGADADLLRAFRSVVVIEAEEGEVVKERKVVELGLRWFNGKSFTLWIDPGCVAVRVGAGPGCAARSEFETGFSHDSSVSVVWGSMVASSAGQGVPKLTVTHAVSRPVEIVRPTPRHYPQTIFASARGERHSRSPSTCSSSASSSCYTGLVRSASLASTASTDATSVTDDSDCPSLCSPASVPSSQEETPESVYDTTVGGGGDATQRTFTGVRLFEEEHEEEEEEEADETIDAAPPTMLGLNVAKKQQLGEGFKPKAVVVGGNYTTHDNGNVGVLGGGVKLGAAGGQRHRQHSAQSKSVSYAQHGLLPRHLNGGGVGGGGHYSAPMPTVPLPQQPYYAQGGYYHQQQPPQYAAPQAPRQMPPPYTTTLPTPYGFATQHQHKPCLQQYYTTRTQPLLNNDHQLVDDDDTVDHAHPQQQPLRRRLRSRGRRSRGRGAGRAARRQAAALRALELGFTDELGELDLEDGESEFSRCSTPASDWQSSVYSSAASSPLKPAAVSKQASSSNLRSSIAAGAISDVDVFGQQLHCGLVRLQAAI